MNGKSLADYSGTQYLKEGNHDVQIESHRMFQYNTGSPGVEFSLRGRGGATKVSFCLHENSLFNLANFARDCGLTEDQMRAYDPHNPASHNVLHGRRVGVVLAPVQHGDKTYHEVDSWYAVDNPPPPPGPIVPVQPVPASRDNECPF